MTDSRFTLSGFALAAALGLTISPAVAQEATYSFDSPLYSQYNWRGINLVNGAVWQPSIDVAYGALNFNFWTNYELTGVSAYTGKGRFTELDTTVTYSGGAVDVDWSVGLIHYQFPSVGAASTTELFGSVSRPMRGFDTTFSAYFDVDQINGTYFNLALDRDLGTISSPTSAQEIGFSWGTAVGFGDKSHNLGYYGNNKAGLADFALYGGFYTTLSDTTDVYLTFQYTTLLDSGSLAGAPNRTNFVTGVGFSVGF